MLENSNGSMYMPVAPMGNTYGGDGMFGGSWMWFLSNELSNVS